MIISSYGADMTRSNDSSSSHLFSAHWRVYLLGHCFGPVFYLASGSSGLNI
jgi:hypothetical protein